MATNKFRFSIKSQPLPDDVNFDTPPQIFLLQYITYVYKKNVYIYIFIRVNIHGEAEIYFYC